MELFWCHKPDQQDTPWNANFLATPPLIRISTLFYVDYENSFGKNNSWFQKAIEMPQILTKNKCIGKNICF